MNTYEKYGTYGANETDCIIYVYEQPNGSKWYAVEGSVNLNCTYEDIDEGCDVELISDFDTATASNAIESEDDLVCAIDDEYTPEEIYISWVNGQREQMVRQLLESDYCSSEFINALDINDSEKLEIAIYLLDQ